MWKYCVKYCLIISAFVSEQSMGSTFQADEAALWENGKTNNNNALLFQSIIYFLQCIDIFP